MARWQFCSVLLLLAAGPTTALAEEERTGSVFGLTTHGYVDRWELDEATRRGTFVIRPYKPVYILPVTWTDDPNELPVSEGGGNELAEPLALDDWEAEFQLSFKTKIWQGVFKRYGDLWLGYTQTSRWQLYNEAASRPFRESNYEPEAILSFATDFRLFGFRGRLLGVSLNHQSNGRADPLSRSWNRVIGMAGFERGDWVVQLRPWWRIPDSAEQDENPAIEDFVGRIEVLVVWRRHGHEIEMTGRHSLRLDERSHGSLQLDWAFPIAGELKGQVQIFTGYGESLIDYNHRQTTIGLGVSLLQWL